MDRPIDKEIISKKFDSCTALEIGGDVVDEQKTK